MCGSTFAGTLIVNRHRVRQDEFEALKAEVKALREKVEECESDRKRLMSELDDAERRVHQLTGENLELLRKVKR